MHDTVEDTDTSYEELKTEFGDRVTLLVKGMTKLSLKKVKNSEDGLFGPLTKASEKDVRIWKIKLSDRADNLKTYLDIATKIKYRPIELSIPSLSNAMREPNITIKAPIRPKYGLFLFCCPNIATKIKIKKYLRETQELLRHVREANIDTPLINEVENSLIPFFKALESNNI